MFHSDRQRSGEARVVEELTARVAAVARGDAVSDAANAIGNDISDIF